MTNFLGGLFGRPQSPHGAPGQPQRGPTGLELLRDPTTALPIAGALLGGRNNRESFGNAFAMAGDARQSAMQRQRMQQQRNRSIEYLKQNRPDLAAQVDAGMPIVEAWKQIHAQPPDRKILKARDGTQRYQDSGEQVFGDDILGPAKPDFETEQKLRKEYQDTNTVKSFGEQTQAYQRVLDSAREPSPAGDLALIFNYMKVLDPGSVVRESEFATAAASGAFGERLKAAAQRIISGERLSEEMRRDFVNEAGQLYEGAASLHGRTNERYRGLSDQYGIEPGRIVYDAAKIGVLNPDWKYQPGTTGTTAAGLNWSLD